MTTVLTCPSLVTRLAHCGEQVFAEYIASSGSSRYSSGVNESGSCCCLVRRWPARRQAGARLAYGTTRRSESQVRLGLQTTMETNEWEQSLGSTKTNVPRWTRCGVRIELGVLDVGILYVFIMIVSVEADWSTQKRQVVPRKTVRDHTNPLPTTITLKVNATVRIRSPFLS